MAHEKPQGTATQPAEFIGELDAGVFEAKLAQALSEVALGVNLSDNAKKKGKVSVTFTLERIGESNQINVEHKLEYKKPTRRGFSSEDDTTSTPMHVGRGGRMTIAPDTQADFFKRTTGEPAE